MTTRSIRKFPRSALDDQKLASTVSVRVGRKAIMMRLENRTDLIGLFDHVAVTPVRQALLAFCVLVRTVVNATYSGLNWGRDVGWPVMMME